MGVNKRVFFVDFASFASVSVSGRGDNTCDDLGAELPTLPCLSLDASRGGGIG